MKNIHICDKTRYAPNQQNVCNPHSITHIRRTVGQNVVSMLWS